MGITHEEIARIDPQLYHMAHFGSWPSIHKHGLLSTTALLDKFRVDPMEREAIESRHRGKTKPIPNTKGAWIRDQKPLNERKLATCLQDGLTPADWYRMLNKRVFFWLTTERLKRLMLAYPSETHLVLEIDTAELLKRHGASVSLTPMNTGSVSPMAFPRGLKSFLPPSDYPFDEYRRKKGSRAKAIVELTVCYSVPDVAAVTNVASHMKIRDGELKILKTIYRRS